MRGDYIYIFIYIYIKSILNYFIYDYLLKVPFVKLCELGALQFINDPLDSSGLTWPTRELLNFKYENLYLLFIIIFIFQLFLLFF